MGCDIHMYLEYQLFDNYWVTFINNAGSRDYQLFGSLAGVRSQPDVLHYPPRGYPKDMAHDTKMNATYVVTEYGDPEDYNRCTPEKAKQYLEYGSVVIEVDDAGQPNLISSPDWHTASWLTLDEYKHVLMHHVMSYGEVSAEYTAILAAGTTLQAAGRETRVVFWFDN